MVVKAKMQGEIATAVPPSTRDGCRARIGTKKVEDDFRSVSRRASFVEQLELGVLRRRGCGFKQKSEEVVGIGRRKREEM